eukprot:365498-Chlamydomonas_euryale.AAC.10
MGICAAPSPASSCCPFSLPQAWAFVLPPHPPHPAALLAFHRHGHFLPQARDLRNNLVKHDTRQGSTYLAVLFPFRKAQDMRHELAQPNERQARMLRHSLKVEKARNVGGGDAERVGHLQAQAGCGLACRANAGCRQRQGMSAAVRGAESRRALEADGWRTWHRGRRHANTGNFISGTGASVW